MDFSGLAGPEAMEEHTVNTIHQYIQAVSELATRWFPSDPHPDIWYRGVKSDEYDLLPGAYFRNPCDEQSITLYFRHLTPSLLHHEPSDDWEWYYAMQHYGVPTRLLDWSESPLAALYFAMEADASGTPVVWVIDPLAMNRAAGWPRIICPYPDTDLNYWLPGLCGRHATLHTFAAGQRFKSNASPLAIYPKRFNPRIVAQRGVFTVHGIDETPINHLDLKDTNGNDRIAIIRFPGAKREALRRDLFLLGITKTSIYPEPQSVADDLKRGFGLC